KPRTINKILMKKILSVTLLFSAFVCLLTCSVGCSKKLHPPRGHVDENQDVFKFSETIIDYKDTVVNTPYDKAEIVLNDSFLITTSFVDYLSPLSFSGLNVLRTDSSISYKSNQARLTIKRTSDAKSSILCECDTLSF